MKNYRLVIACLLLGFSSSAFAELLIYSGSVKQMRPGTKLPSSREIFVMQTQASGEPLIAILAPGSGDNERWIARYSLEQINDFSPIDANRNRWGGFLLIRGKTVIEGRSETNLQLTSNYTRNPAELSRPRTVQGRLTTIKNSVAVVFVIIDGQPPAIPQNPDLSELSFVFSLDARRTAAAKKANQSFDDIVNPLPRLLGR